MSLPNVKEDEGRMISPPRPMPARVVVISRADVQDAVSRNR
jgi:hypothetical protein